MGIRHIIEEQLDRLSEEELNELSHYIHQHYIEKTTTSIPFVQDESLDSFFIAVSMEEETQKPKSKRKTRKRKNWIPTQIRVK